MNKKEFTALKNWMEEQYGKGTETTINYEGKQITGIMYGNDECWDMNDFYQYLLTGDALFKAYFEVPEGCEDLGSLDYNNPINLKDADAQYFIKYVI